MEEFLLTYVKTQFSRQALRELRRKKAILYKLLLHSLGDILLRDLFGKLKSDLMEICKLIVELEDLTGLPIDIIPLDEAPPKLLQKFLSLIHI